MLEIQIERLSLCIFEFLFENHIVYTGFSYIHSFFSNIISIDWSWKSPDMTGYSKFFIVIPSSLLLMLAGIFEKIHCNRHTGKWLIWLDRILHRQMSRRIKLENCNMTIFGHREVSWVKKRICNLNPTKIYQKYVR